MVTPDSMGLDEKSTLDLVDVQYNDGCSVEGSDDEDIDYN